MDTTCVTAQYNKLSTECQGFSVRNPTLTTSKVNTTVYCSMYTIDNQMQFRNTITIWHPFMFHTRQSQLGALGQLQSSIEAESRDWR